MVRLGRCATNLVEGNRPAVADRTRKGTTHSEVKKRGKEERTSGTEERKDCARSTARDLIRSFD